MDASVAMTLSLGVFACIVFVSSCSLSVVISQHYSRKSWSAYSVGFLLSMSTIIIGGLAIVAIVVCLSRMTMSTAEGTVFQSGIPLEAKIIAIAATMWACVFVLTIGWIIAAKGQRRLSADAPSV
jgi:hypothetical protein